MNDVIAAVSRGVMATLADGTLRVKIDIEPADAEAAFKLLGMPGNPIAIARLAVGAPVESRGEITPDVPPPPKGGALARLAGVWCSLPSFQDWVADTYRPQMELAMMTRTSPEEAVAQVVREICGVDSRAELDSDEVAAGLFHERFRRPFSAHMERGANFTERGR